MSNEKKQIDNRQNYSREFVQFEAKERNVWNVKSLKVEARSRHLLNNNLQLITYNL